MLIKFSLRNYKVFRDKAELSLIASNYDKGTNEENLIEVPKFGLRLLKSAVVYGANASGKSKLIEALGYMRNFVHVSSKDSQKGDEIPVEPFRLSTVFENEPTEFEVTFIHNDALYRYGFEATQREIIAEWLYHRPNTKEVELFYRERQQIDLHKRSFSGIVSQLVKGNNIRENALLLSVAAQFNDKQAGNVFDWFNRLRITSGLDDDDYAGYTLEQTQQPEYKNIVLKLLQVADLNIKDFEVQTMIPTGLLANVLKGEWDGKTIPLNTEAQTIHAKYNENNLEVGSVIFSLNDDESSGTQKFFAIVAPIIDALFDGSVFIVDELDAKLHPNLVCLLVDLFHSSTNTNNAQLIFNTHDTNLLSSGNFRRDQIWFTEKDRYGASILYSLADYKPRKGENFERNYIEGKYGAIPFLGDYSKLFNQQSTHARTKE